MNSGRKMNAREILGNYQHTGSKVPGELACATNPFDQTSRLCFVGAEDSDGNRQHGPPSCVWGK